MPLELKDPFFFWFFFLVEKLTKTLKMDYFTKSLEEELKPTVKWIKYNHMIFAPLKWTEMGWIWQNAN